MAASSSTQHIIAKTSKSSPFKSSPLACLNDDVVPIIGKYLPLSDLPEFEEVSPEVAKAVEKDNDYWMRCFKTHFPQQYLDLSGLEHSLGEDEESKEEKAERKESKEIKDERPIICWRRLFKEEEKKQYRGLDRAVIDLFVAVKEGDKSRINITSLSQLRAQDRSGRTIIDWANDKRVQDEKAECVLKSIYHQSVKLLQQEKDAKRLDAKEDPTNYLVKCDMIDDFKSIVPILERPEYASYTQSLFLQAAAAGASRIVQYMILQEMVRRDSKCNGLWDAAKNGHIETVRFLINQGVRGFHRALDWAAKNEHLGVIRLLIERSEFPKTTRYYNSYRCDLESLMDSASSSALSSSLSSSLSCAVEGGPTKTVEFLIDYIERLPLPPAERSCLYIAAFFSAASNGYAEIISRLLPLVARIKEEALLHQDTRMLNEYARILGRALWNAARCGHAKIVEFLMEQGADVNGVYSGCTAIGIATKERHAAVIRVLLADDKVNLDRYVLHSLHHRGMPYEVARDNEDSRSMRLFGAKFQVAQAKAEGRAVSQEHRHTLRPLNVQNCIDGIGAYIRERKREPNCHGGIVGQVLGGIFYRQYVKADKIIAGDALLKLVLKLSNGMTREDAMDELNKLPKTYPAVLDKRLGELYCDVHEVVRGYTRKMRSQILVSYDLSHNPSHW